MYGCSRIIILYIVLKNIKIHLKNYSFYLFLINFINSFIIRKGSYIYNILLIQIVFKARFNLPCRISPVNDVGIINFFRFN